jgi:hypothetical protein
MPLPTMMNAGLSYSVPMELVLLLIVRGLKLRTGNLTVTQKI